MSDKLKKKPGPKEERLKIETDPKRALETLLGKRSTFQLIFTTSGAEPKHVSEHQTFASAKRSAETYWKEAGCDSDRGDSLWVIKVPGKSQPEAVYSGLWQ